MIREETIETTAITLKMIIDKGILKPNSLIVSLANSNVLGKLNEDGSLTITFQGQERSFPYPSGAARFVEKKSLNGWLYWCVAEKDCYKALSYYRKKYLEISI